MEKDLTKGNPLKLLFLFSLPMLLGNLFQQFYSIVDSIIVGRLVGQDALAAVGASFPIIFLAVAIADGTEMGCSIVISHLFGAKRIHEMKTTVYTSLISLTALGLIITVIGESFSVPLLNLLGTNADIMADSLIYIRIYFAGAVFVFLYNTLRGIYIAQGDSKTPLIFLVISSFMNIALDLLFVLSFNMGVAGTAWATLISQGMSAILSLLVLLKRIKKMGADKDEQSKSQIELFDKKIIKSIIHISIPSVLQQSVVSISMMCMQGLVNSFGKVFVAGYTAAVKIDSLAMIPNMNFSNALSCYTAQNIGAGKEERIKRGFKASIFMVILAAIVITAVIFLFGTNLVGLFLEKGTDGSAIDYGISYLRAVSLFYAVMGLMFVGNGLLKGAGDMKSFLFSSISNLFFRIIIAYVLAHFIQEKAIWCSIPIGWCVGAAVAIGRIMSGRWKKRKLLSKE